MELLAELAMRFPKGGDGADDDIRLRLLAEDLSETMGATELAAAIKVGKRDWRFLPTLAEIVEAGAEYRAERRDRQQADDMKRTAVELLAPPPTLDEQAERIAMMAELRAKIDAGHAKLMGKTDAPVVEPLSWRLTREAKRNVSPQLEAWRDEMFAR